MQSGAGSDLVSAGSVRHLLPKEFDGRDFEQFYIKLSAALFLIDHNFENIMKGIEKARLPWKVTSFIRMMS